MKLKSDQKEAADLSEVDTGSFFLSIKKWLFSLGPGIITAALVFGPSKITISSKLGAEYGFSLLLFCFFSIFFMGIFLSVSAIIVIETKPINNNKNPYSALNLEEIVILLGPNTNAAV